MTSIRAKVLAALVATLGLTAMSPAFAAGAHQRPGTSDGPTLEFRRDTAGGAFRFAELSCSPRAADRLDNRLDRMAGRLDLTSEQQKLFEDFRTSVLTAQTDFADQCADLRPARDAGKAERPDLIQRLEQRLKFDEARLAAMTDLLPQFKAFYQSLSDEQKAALMPRNGFRQGLEAPQPGARFHRPGTPAAPTPGLDGLTQAPQVESPSNDRRAPSQRSPGVPSRRGFLPSRRASRSSGAI